MEISEKEYLELKEQIRRLQSKVDGISNPPKDLRSRVSETPISHVRNVKCDEPIFDYAYSSCEASWVEFVKLAKLLHRPSDNFYMDSAFDCHGQDRKPYIRSYRTGEALKKITEMSEEQIQVSIDMLNELIPIYNKYFRKTHQTVFYSENKDGIYKPVQVFRVEDEELLQQQKGE